MSKPTAPKSGKVAKSLTKNATLGLNQQAARGDDTDGTYDVAPRYWGNKDAKKIANLRERAELINADRAAAARGNMTFGPIVGDASLLNGGIDQGRLSEIKSLQSSEREKQFDNFVERYDSRDGFAPYFNAAAARAQHGVGPRKRTAVQGRHGRSA